MGYCKTIERAAKGLGLAGIIASSPLANSQEIPTPTPSPVGGGGGAARPSSPYFLANMNILHQATNYISDFDVGSNYVALLDGGKVIAVDLKNNLKLTISESTSPIHTRVANETIVWSSYGLNNQGGIYTWDLTNGVKKLVSLSDSDLLETSNNKIVYTTDDMERFFLLPIGGIPTELHIPDSRRIGGYLVEDDKLKYVKRNAAEGFNKLIEYNFNTFEEKAIFAVADLAGTIEHLASSGSNTTWILSNDSLEKNINSLYFHDGEKISLINTSPINTTEDLIDGMDVERQRIVWLTYSGEINYWTPRTGISRLVSGLTNNILGTNIRLKNEKIYIGNSESITVAEVKRSPAQSPKLIFGLDEDDGRYYEVRINSVLAGTKVRLYNSQDLATWNLLREYIRNPYSPQTLRYYPSTTNNMQFYRVTVENLPE